MSLTIKQLFKLERLLGPAAPLINKLDKSIGLLDPAWIKEHPSIEVVLFNQSTLGWGEMAQTLKVQNEKTLTTKMN